MDRKAPAGFSAEHLDSAEVICVDRSADACTDPREDACIKLVGGRINSRSSRATSEALRCVMTGEREGKQWRRLSM